MTPVLAVFAPYDRSETCLAAMRLADLAMSAGFGARYVSAGRCLRGVHPFWDTRVRSCRSRDMRGFAELVRGVTHAVWFDYGESQLDLVRALCGDVRTFYVAAGHGMFLGEWSAAASAGEVVCPTHAARLLAERLLDLVGGHRPPLSVCGWTCGMPDVTRRPRRRLAPSRVTAYCDTNSVDDCAPLVLRSLVALARELRDLRVHVLAAKTWSRRDRRLLRGVTADSGGQISCGQQQGVCDLHAALMDSDWLLLPGVRAGFGLAADVGNAFGLPVVCYDVEPFSSVVEDGRNGVLVPCELHADRTGWASAVPSAAAMYRRLAGTLTDAGYYNGLRSRDWGRDAADREFCAFWLDRLGLNS